MRCTHLGHFKFNGISIGACAYTFYCTKKYTWQCDHFGLCEYESMAAIWKRTAIWAVCASASLHVALACLLEIIDCRMWFMVIARLWPNRIVCARMRVYAGRVLRLLFLFHCFVSFHLLFACTICMQMRPIRIDRYSKRYSLNERYPGGAFCINGFVVSNQVFLESSVNCKPIVCFVRRFACVLRNEYASIENASIFAFNKNLFVVLVLPFVSVI